MSQQELLIAGTQLMILGMGTVFIFLAMLIGSLKLMSFLVGRLPNDQINKTTESLSTAEITTVADTELVAVITAAITKYRILKKLNKS